MVLWFKKDHDMVQPRDNSPSRKIAAVTGGGSGLGAATAHRLARDGYRVAILDLQRENAEAVARHLNAERPDCALALQVNVADPVSVDAAFVALEQRWGQGPDVLVNSAGIMPVAPVLDCSYDMFRTAMDVNVGGSFLCSQRAARGMAERRFGRIVNLASISSERAGVGRVAYGTSKTAIAGLTRQFAMELGPLGITVNAIAPGPVLTAMTEKNYTPETRQAFEASIPARRMGRTEEMADAIAFLCSDGAAYINGVLLPVDGGYLAAGIATTAGLKA